MNKVTTGLIAGGAIGMIGLGIAMADRNTRNKIVRSGNNIRHKAENIFDDMRYM